MNDDPFDEILERRIEESLAVDPSPAFTARVRQHIAAHSGAVASFDWRRCMVFGTFVAAIGVAVLLLRSTGPERAPSGTTSLKIQNTAPLPVTPATTVVVARRSTVTPVRKQSRAERVVLVPSAEVEGFRRLVQGVNNGRVDLLQLAQLQGAEAEFEAPHEIEISPLAAFEPLRIEPLDNSAQEQRGNP